MSVNWIDVSNLSFNTLLLLEHIQLSWFPGWLPEAELADALWYNPVVEWYLRNKCPQLNGWLDDVKAREKVSTTLDPVAVRNAEEVILRSINDLVVYVVDPSVYDAQPFLGWDSVELTDLVDFGGKVVIDVGSGTGRLALVAAKDAEAVFAVEPVANLRRYMREKSTALGLRNVFPIDGLITEIPLPDGFADVTMGGHVFGDHPEEEYLELKRVSKAGGMVILCPGNNDIDDGRHQILLSKGFSWSSFEEPEDGIKRKYWKVI